MVWYRKNWKCSWAFIRSCKEMKINEFMLLENYSHKCNEKYYKCFLHCHVLLLCTVHRNWRTCLLPPKCLYLHKHPGAAKRATACQVANKRRDVWNFLSCIFQQPLWKSVTSYWSTKRKRITNTQCTFSWVYEQPQFALAWYVGCPI